MKCYACGRKCGVNRFAGETGFCRATEKMTIAAVGPHMWEEPCISGEHGSGTIFFAGCSLQCIFCQNHEISRIPDKCREVSVIELRSIFRELEESGVHNINLVNPTHYALQIAQALDEKPNIPVVWNSSGYENTEMLRMLKGKVDIYLPDFKYSDNELAKQYSNVSDYFEVSVSAINEMYSQVGNYVLDGNGIMTSGVIVRHLILPCAIENSKNVITSIAKYYNPGEIMFSLMSQFTPNGQTKCPTLNRKITRREYAKVEQFLFDSGIEDGFVQDLDSANDNYLPIWEFV